MTTAFAAAAGVPWAIYEPALHTLLEIADRHPVTPEVLAAWKRGEVEPWMQPAAVATRTGPALDGTRSVQMRDGVAVVPVHGPIFRYANLMTRLSGATSLALLAQDFAAAVESRDVRAILLDVNSPGGEVAGIAEFAAQVRAAAGVKPVAAYVDHMAASAGYWIAAAAPDMAVASQSVLGSIGVVSTHLDQREREAKAGVRRIEIVSSQSPWKRTDPTTDEGRERLQALVDRLAAGFVAAVAGFRAVSEEKVLQDFGQGGLLVGADAVAAGMAARVSSFEEVLAVLAGRTRSGAVRSSSRETRTMAETTRDEAGVQPAPITADIIREKHPDIAAAFRAEGAERERARILGIEAQALPGHEALIAGLKADGTTTPEQAAVKVLAAERQKGADQLRMRRDDERATEGTGPMADATQAPPRSGSGKPANPLVDDGRPLEERAKAAWGADAELRGEFKSFATYLGFLTVQAQASRR
ncbi:S49 family peptidase [Azospirillum sp. ST 5-10]|uniref:S49 family peptidase n=1 Tax=unclassified Azospirillum TaxID=2630922 RepID=UPI003F4A7C41